MSYSVALVTCYYEIYEQPDKSFETRLDEFIKLAETGLPIYLFCDSSSAIIFERELQRYPHVLCISSIAVNDLYAFQVRNTIDINEVTLPRDRNMNKDSMNYLLLMNSKTEFIQKAIQIDKWKTEHFAWIDYSLFYIVKNQSSVSHYMKQWTNMYFLEKSYLMMPGCWTQKPDWNMDRILNYPCWRFCGGFFIGSKDRLLDFHESAQSHFYDFVKENKALTWEVNYWSWLEQTNKINPTVYFADHDDSILRIPMQSYVIPLAAVYETTTYEYPIVRSYEPGSASMVKFKGSMYVNTRFVNYWYTNEGKFGINDVIGNIKTKNIMSELNDKLIPINYHEMDEKTIGFESKWSRCYGLEDIRLFTYDNKMYYLATNINYTHDSVNSMMMGEYDLPTMTYKNSHFLHSPYKRCMQKNWIPLVWKEDLWFIYRWFPLEIGKLDDKHTLVIHKNYVLKEDWFRDIRGSSNFVEYKEYLVGIVHFSIDGCPRKYFHRFVALNKETLEPVSYTDNFFFRRIGIEFCLGLEMVNNDYACWISRMDRDPLMLKLDMEKVIFTHRFQS